MTDSTTTVCLSSSALGIIMVNVVQSVQQKIHDAAWPEYYLCVPWDDHRKYIHLLEFA